MDLSSVLKDIRSIGDGSRASIWKTFGGHTNSILQVAEWVQTYADRIIEYFPQTKVTGNWDRLTAIAIKA